MTRNHVSTLLIALLIVVVAVVIGIEMVKKNNGGIACTLEAKLCPDGSAVGRTGPHCEFALCPGEIPIDQSGIQGIVLLGPTCPVVQDPPDPGCADRPYAARLVLTTQDGLRVIKEFNSDANGVFYITALPGAYAIRSAVAANILPYCSSSDALEVHPHERLKVVIHCDTGIR